MQAPVLTKNQVKKAINKKTPKKKSLRNVLSRPTTYDWPLISDKKAKPLIEFLKNSLQYKHDVKIKWHVLKNVPQDKRKEVREEKKIKLGGGKKPESLKNLVFGINGVMRGLEKRIITSVMISSDVNPVDMVKPIWYTCVNSKIPVIVVPSLRNVMKNAVGIPCMIVGLLKNAPDTLYETIYQLSKQFNPEMNQSDEIIELDETMKIGDTIVIDDTMMEDTEDSEESDSDTTDAKNKRINDQSKAKKQNIYLYRTDTTKRCFIPPKSNNVVNNTLEWDSSFIPFSENMDISVNSTQLETVDECGDSSIDDTDKSLSQLETVDECGDSSIDGTDKNLSQLETVDECGDSSIDIDTTIIHSQNVIKNSSKKPDSPKKEVNIHNIETKITYRPVSIKRLQSNPHRKKKTTGNNNVI